ncbi:MAG: hypothetical protein JXB62_01650 [Pirellulales bacterium]|nr:hypothetical protein [Pirellulales bacterium]
MKRLLPLVLLAALLATPATAAVRRWTDKTGRFSVEAELIDHGMKEISLKKANGKTVRVPISELSRQDQLYLKNLRATVARKMQRQARVKGAPFTTVEEALTHPTKLALDNAPLGEMLAQIERHHEIDVFLDRTALAAVGFSDAVRISANHADTPLAAALDATLGPAGLTWLVRNGVLLITTPEAESRSLQTRVYALVGAARPDVVLQQLSQRVAASSWAQVGGPGCGVALSSGALLISQSYRVHRQIEKDFAQQLRPVVGGPKDKAPRGGPRETPTTRALREPAVAEFAQVPLSDVIGFLASQHHLDIKLDPDGAKDVGAGASAKFSANMRHVPVADLLDLMLPQHDLTWIVEGNGVLITSPQQAAAKMTTVDYPVGDLRLRGNLGELAAAVTQTVYPTSWDQVGGRGTIRPAANGQALSITQTYAVHRRIEQLLRDLRALQALR